MSNKAESDYATAVYRCRDSIKNFKIRIRLQQEKSSLIPLPDFQPHAGEAEPSLQSAMEGSKFEERVFTWQEKVFSPTEITRYQHAANCHTQLEVKYHHDVKELCNKGMPNNRLFSCTDADDFTDMEEVSVTTDVKPSNTYLVSGVSDLRQRQKFTLHRKSHQSKQAQCTKRDIVDYTPSEETRKKNHLIESFPQVMYILADLSVKEGDTDTAWFGKSEYVLCTIRYDPSSRVLTITPDFVFEQQPTRHRLAASYRVEVDGDARNVYQYWVEHASADITADERDREIEVVNKLYAHRSEVRQLAVGTEFDCPRRGALRTLVLGEIRSASHFDYDHLFVHYFIELPPGWSGDDPTQLSGFTQTCRTRGTGVARFAHLFEIALSYHLETLHDNPDILPSWPQLFIEVLSLDSWSRYRTDGYGYVNIPPTAGVHNLKVSTWRPLSNSPVGEMRRFFVGGSPELEDPAYSYIPNGFKGTLLSKYGLRTVSSGDVHIQLNVIHQSQALVGTGDKTAGASKHATFLLERLSAATLVNSVNTVLNAFKHARERMLAAKQGLEAPS